MVFFGGRWARTSSRDPEVLDDISEEKAAKGGQRPEGDGYNFRFKRGDMFLAFKSRFFVSEKQGDVSRDGREKRK